MPVPHMALVPHMAFVPHMALVPHIALVPHMALVPHIALVPHMAFVPHIALLPQRAFVAEVAPLPVVVEAGAPVTNTVEPQTSELVQAADVFQTEPTLSVR